MELKWRPEGQLKFIESLLSGEPITAEFLLKRCLTPKTGELILGEGDMCKITIYLTVDESPLEFSRTLNGPFGVQRRESPLSVVRRFISALSV
jgi:hypothetical protein